MSRAVVLVLLAASAGRAQPPAEVVAVEQAFRKVIAAAEPSVACVLVSRSEKYQQLGEGPKSESQLGGFTPIRPRFGDAARKDLIRQLDLANPETVPEGYGSGVVIDERGLVLTNFHVIDGATKVYVRLPGPNRGSYADILAGDARSDLAVLKMLQPPADLAPVRFGDGGKVRKGDLVVSLANPFAAGFRDGSPGASWGIVSNLRRRVAGPADETKRARPLAQYGTLIQTDARLTLGTSGGALLNLNGELVGLTTSLAALTGSETAGGYAIPLDANVKKMIEVLKRGEEIEYGFLGVTVNPDARETGAGVRIADVAPGMPAARAGLMNRDLVTGINGNPVREQDDLFLNIAAALAGSEVEIEVRRAGVPGTRTVKARLAKSRHDEKVIASARPRAVFGLRVDYTSTIPTDTGAPEGVLVKEVDAGSPAEKKLKAWMGRASLIVVAVDGQPVPTPADFYRAAAGKGSVTLDIVEAGRAGGARERKTLP